MDEKTEFLRSTSNSTTNYIKLKERYSQKGEWQIIILIDQIPVMLHFILQPSLWALFCY